MSISPIDSQSSVWSWSSATSGGPAASQETFAEVAQRVTSQRDEDGDGQLSAQEMGVSADRFSQMDANGDGYVSEEEFALYLDSGKGDDSLYRMANMLVDQQDSDGDGKISRAESTLSNDLFEAYDKDGDGHLTAEELVQAMGGGEDLSQQLSGGGSAEGGTDGADSRHGSFSLTDADGENGSGKKANDTNDLNGDGVVSAEEIQAVLQHGLQKARAMVASGELTLESSGMEGAAQGAGAAGGVTGAAAKGDQAGRSVAEPLRATGAGDTAVGASQQQEAGTPVWLRRKAMATYGSVQNESSVSMYGQGMSEHGAGIAEAEQAGVVPGMQAGAVGPASGAGALLSSVI